MVLEKIVYDPDSFAVPELFAFEVLSVLHHLHPHGLQTLKMGIIPSSLSSAGIKTCSGNHDS